MKKRGKTSLAGLVLLLGFMLCLAGKGIAGPACSESIAEGSFEAGTPNPFWTEASTNFGTPLCDDARGTRRAKTGSWWAWFGGIDAGETGSLEQSVILPSGNAQFLKFYLWIEHSSGNGTDFLKVKVDGNEVFSVREGNTLYTEEYTLVTIDLSAYADGGSHLLSFESTITGSPVHSNFFVDDVSIRCQSGPPEPLSLNISSAAMTLGSEPHSFQIKGTLNSGPVDFVSTPVTVRFGTYSETIPAGTFTNKKGKYSFKKSASTPGIYSATIDSAKKTIQINAKNINMSGTTNPARFLMDMVTEYACVILTTVPDKKGTKWSFKSGGTQSPCDAEPQIITGKVAKGSVSGATVKFFALNADGTKGDLLGTTATNTDGKFTTAFMVPSSPMLAEASGGSYVNEVSGTTDILYSSDTLTAVLPAGTIQAAVTPLTHMAAARARTLAASGIPLAVAVNASNIGVAQQYMLSDILGTLPASANDAAEVQASSREERNYGIVLAGLTQGAADLHVRPIDLAAALATDMGDGILDGLGENAIPVPAISARITALDGVGGLLAGNPIPVPTIGPVGPVITLPDTALAINAFLASGNNLTNLAGKDISTVPVNINPAGGTYFINATALPAWVEGRPGTARLTASGGTPPYAWAVTPGSALPPWPMALATVANQGVLTGTAPILAAGSTMRITPPFSVTCTDVTPGPIGPLRQAIQLTVTIIKAPPTLNAVNGTCIAGTPNTDILVATAAGGVPPYYFKSPSFMYGAPPLGMGVWTVSDTIYNSGHLKGTCPRPGVYRFPVVVVDSIGANNDPLNPVYPTLTIKECAYSISPTSNTLGSPGGTGSVRVTASSGCNWTATSNLSWIAITSGSSGTGNGTVNYSVAANSGTDQRVGMMTIAGKTFTVTQTGSSPCTYSISPTSKSFDSTGGTGSVSVTASSDGCKWTAASNSSWITITSGSSGTGNGTVNYSVAANTRTNQRVGTMTIAGKTFTVTQTAASCTYSISPTSKSFDSTGGTGSVSVTASSDGCNWTAASNSSWIAITSGSSGTGNGTVNYSVAANSSADQRVGTMTIAGKTFTVTQSGSSPCTYSISPTSNTFGSPGGTGSVGVTASSGCNWTATSNSSWIAITSGSSGTGNGTVNYSVAANSGADQRVGTMTIAGKTFTVTQSGSSSNPFHGSVQGNWSGTCTSGFNVSGTFAITIGSNGAVTGTYIGDDSGTITGSVDTNGNYSASGGAGDASWSGSFSVSGTTLSGSGSWSEPSFGCSGTWSGTGTATH